MDSGFVKTYLEPYAPEGVYQPYFVNSFSSLGWQDPFPHEKSPKPGLLEESETLRFPGRDAVHANVYPDSRYVEN